MKDIEKMAAALRHAVAEGRPAALATVVKLEGSGYRRPGARMVVLEDGTRIGFLSGGCLEADVAEHARQAFAAKSPRLITYDGRSSFDPVAELGCNGSIQILVEPVTEAVERSLTYVKELVGSRRYGAMVTVFRTEGGAPLRVGERLMSTDGTIEGVIDPSVLPSFAGMLESAPDSGRAQVEALMGDGWAAEVLVEPIAPPISLILCGAGYDALPLAALGRSLGWKVTVTDHREHLLSRDRFPEPVDLIPETAWNGVTPDERTAAVVMSHSYCWDLRMLRFLSESPVGYVGLLGPRKRAQQMRMELLAEGVTLAPCFVERLHAPVGLDLGAETAEEIALSVAAEIQAFFAGQRAGFLRERHGSIHGPAE